MRTSLTMHGSKVQRSQKRANRTLLGKVTALRMIQSVVYELPE